MHPETLELLENAMEGEMKKFLENVNKLENAELYDFVREVASLTPNRRYTDSVSDVIGIARNIKAIEDAVENFYST